MMRNLLTALLLTLGAAAIAVPAKAATTWDAANCNAGVTLSSGDTVATATSASLNNCRSTTSHNFDRNYVIEFQLDSDSALTSNHGILVGFADASANLVAGQYVGADTHGMGKPMNGASGATVFCQVPAMCTTSAENGADAGGAGTKFFLAVDTNGKVWASTDCSTWGTTTPAIGGDPGAHTNPFVTIVNTSPIYLATTFANQGGATFEKTTILPSAPDCSALPSGYVAWDPASGSGGLLLRSVGN